MAAVLTGQYFVTRALRLLQVVDPTETPDAEDLSDGFDTLNEWMSTFKTQPQGMFAIGEHVYNLSANTQDYSIGVGGTFNQERPLYIEGVSITPDKTATPLLKLPIGRPLTLERWRQLIARAATAEYPSASYYNYAWAAGLATLSVYPKPTSSNAQIVLYTRDALAEFATPTTVYTFPPGYARMIRYSLALDLADDFDVSDQALLARIAKRAAEATAWVKRANWRPKDAHFVQGGSGIVTSRNVYTDR